MDAGINEFQLWKLKHLVLKLENNSDEAAFYYSIFHGGVVTQSPIWSQLYLVNGIVIQRHCIASYILPTEVDTVKTSSWGSIAWCIKWVSKHLENIFMHRKKSWQSQSPFWMNNTWNQDMAASFAASNAKSTVPVAFRKNQLLIRCVLLLIDQWRWTWMNNPHSNSGHVTEEIFFLCPCRSWKN